jgi:hypothetical protein
MSLVARGVSVVGGVSPERTGEYGHAATGEVESTAHTEGDRARSHSHTMTAGDLRLRS